MRGKENSLNLLRCSAIDVLSEELLLFPLLPEDDFNKSKEE